MPMAERTVKIWYDPKGDYLEVIFDQKPGYFRETASDQVVEKVDDHGNILSFSMLKVPRPLRAKRTAMLVMHGIGEHNPYETLDSVARNLARYLRDEWGLTLTIVPEKIEHGDELAPAGEAPGMAFGIGLLDCLLEVDPGETLEELAEHAHEPIHC